MIKPKFKPGDHVCFKEGQLNKYIHEIEAVHFCDHGNAVAYELKGFYPKNKSAGAICFKESGLSRVKVSKTFLEFQSMRRRKK